MKTDVKKLMAKSDTLNHLENQKVITHVQRKREDWIQNTVMLEGYDVPFKYQRKQMYQTLKGAQVNVTYYATKESVAGMDFEVMKVVRIKVS